MNIKTLVVFFALAFFGGASAFADTESVTWEGIAPATAVKGTTEQQTVYFYNVGKKLFLAQGGNWGQEAVLSEIGIPYTINYNSEHKNYHFKQTDEGTYLCPVSVENDKKYVLYFLTGHSASYGFNFTETAEGSGQYRISYDNGDYFMVGADVTGTTAGADKDHRISIMNETQRNSVTDNSDVWILVSLKEMEEKLISAAKTSKTLFEDQNAPCSYLVKDHDFARNSVNLGCWQIEGQNNSFSSLSKRDVTVNVPTETVYPNYSYYVGNGYTSDDSIQSTTGDKWTANIFARGTIQQTVNIATVGWYQVTANVGKNSRANKVKLFARAGDETGGGRL